MEQFSLDDFLGQFKGHIKIAESGIGIDTLKEFAELSGNVPETPLEKSEMPDVAARLNDVNSPESERKALLCRLAKTGSVEAFRTLEQFCEHGSPELKRFASLAMSHTRHLLESDLLDTTNGLIITGLGGKGDKLRYHYIMAFLEAVQPSEAELVLIEDEIRQTAAASLADTEIIGRAPTHLAVTALVPLDVAVGQVIEACIGNSNAISPVFAENYFVTNGYIPDAEEAASIAQQLRETLPPEEATPSDN